MRSTNLNAAITLMGLLAWTAGCGQPPATVDEHAATQQPGGEDEHHHHGTGPHGGTVADWGGGKYHIEFTVDHATQQATVYILDGDARQAVPIEADSLTLSIQQPAFQVELAAAPLPGESAGAASRFVGQHERLGVEQNFSGTISGLVAGTPYAGDFHEEAHDHTP